ncbi:hypothetical protein EDD27_3603 [Nonomuraea polychroma]|uniref:Uncharacterized protein n=1 Tax=Nonomuraea polychroma TaxID=46176 RepID=A0A438M5L1_9ACTN|nr:hypothetical protein [Nonomuraea polychroma]RVX41134.1 hypothetical protein EDD27_3603 [Nonomuraea polychroma]
MAANDAGGPEEQSKGERPQRRWVPIVTWAAGRLAWELARLLWEKYFGNGDGPGPLAL